MRILFITHDRPSDGFGGSDRSLLNLIEGLSDHGHQAAVAISTKGYLSSELQTREIPHVTTPYRNSMVGSYQFSDYFSLRKGAARGLLRNLRKRQLDYVSSRRIAAYAKIFAADLIYTNSLVTSIGYKTSKLLNIPHIWHIREDTNAQWGSKPYVGYKTYGQWLSNSFRAIAITSYVAKVTKQQYGCTNISVVHNGVASKEAMKQYRLKKKQKDLSAAITVGLIGDISPFKGQDQAIEAFAQASRDVPNLQLKLVGGGQIEWAKDLAQKHGVFNKVEFTGLVKDPWDQLATFDISLMCSIAEPMGRVTAESMAMELPVIGRDSGGTTELIEDDIDGLLYDGTPADLAAKIVRLASSKSYRTSMGEKGGQHALTKYSTEAYTSKVLPIIESIPNLNK